MLESKLQILMTHIILQTEITKDPAVHGSTLVPILLGSDKTIASVGMGNVEYYPLYMSIRNLHNDIRHAHRGGVAAIGFLAIPTCESSVMSIGMYVNLLHFTGEKKDEKTKRSGRYCMCRNESILTGFKRKPRYRQPLERALPEWHYV